MSPIKILHEDQDILVIDKPAGMVVNRADTTRAGETLQDWAVKNIKYQISNIKYQVDEESDFVKRSGIVHRLDKETSGIILVAKDPQTFADLQRQFKQGQVEKTYIALVHGKVVPEAGEISVPVGRLPWNRMRFGVLPAGRESVTKYKILNIKYQISKTGREPLSLVEVYPKTGRTHQIRVHFQYLGHPVFADELYAGRKISRADRKLLPRHFLHAAKIKVVHPKDGRILEFESPLPPDLSNFLLKLGNPQVQSEDTPKV